MSKFLGLPFSAKGRALYAFWLPALLFILLISGNCVSAQSKPGVFTQRVTYKASNLSMSKALKEIRAKAKLKLTYNTELINRQAPVTVDVKDGTVEVLLQQLLANTKLKFVADPTGGITIYEPETTSFSESREVNGVILRGRVTDPSGNPLSGVSIRATESKLMTVTQSDGFFTMVPRPNEELSFSRIGMKPLVYKVKPILSELVSFTMDTIAREIQEVVVNGYQKIDPRLATGSVYKLKAADILQPGQPTVDRMLQGKVPGLMVMNATGSVNGKPTLRLRGTSTLLGNAQPLWVIDGMIRPNPVDISSAVLNSVISNASQSNFDLMGNAISGVNPYDIESITILKDAAATAIYGTSAANGVIVVTTKRGKSGPMQVSYNTNISFQSRPSYDRLNLMNSKERVELSKQFQEDGILASPITSGLNENVSYEGLLMALYSRKIDEATFNQQVGLLETRNTDWFKLLFRNQVSMQHSLSISGGNAKTTYYASLSYAGNNGSAIKDGNKMYSANVNLRSELGKKVTLDVTLNSSYRNATGYYNTVNPLTYALQTHRGYDPNAFYPIKNTQSGDSYGYSDARKRVAGLLFNPLNEIDHTENNSSTRSTSLNLSLDYKIGGGWVFRHNSSVISDNASGMSAADDRSYYVANLRQWNFGEIIDETSLLYTTSRLPYGGIADIMSSDGLMLRMKNAIDYTRGFFKDRDQFNFSLGNEIISQKANSVYSTEPGYYPDRGKTFFPADISRKYLSTTTLSNDLKNSVSYYGTAAYSLMNRYIISGTLRSDGSNRFGQYSNGKFLPNYSISGRWNAGAENWFPVSSLISEWQITASYGTQGNVVTAVGPELIATYAQNGVGDQITHVPFLQIKSLPYPDLRWEKTGQWNFGTSASFLDRRLLITAEYYSKKTVDVLDMVDIPLEYGEKSMYRNASELFNSGLEFSVNANIVRRKNTNFSVNFMSSRNFNRVSDKAVLSNYASLFDGSGHLAGKAISGFYSYIFNGLDHNTGLPTFANMNTSVKTNNPDDFLVYSGQMFPKITGSITPSFRYKSVTVNALFYVSLGSSKRLNDPYSQSRVESTIPAPYSNLSREYFNRWRKPGDEAFTNVPVMKDLLSAEYYILSPYTTIATSGTQLKTTVNPYAAYNLSDLRVIKNDYLRCNSMNINYSFSPATLKRVNAKGASIGFSVNNVFTIANSKLKGQDPEIDGVGSTALPLTRQYAFSLNATF